jgi:hypothetical protein
MSIQPDPTPAHTWPRLRRDSYVRTPDPLPPPQGERSAVISEEGA